LHNITQYRTYILLGHNKLIRTEVLIM